ncbi:anthranilate synthase component I family protein ['Paenibacillus yunnanensis' Narsing Rao et al. 2020]|uniref:anthranilate synthase component I family protein n=1 Tax=Paenibacillus tengchongensis TaxID=2608684 RepID=UPI00124E7C29|nr:anthranilate synthase component I family protein [Paenibacillus tengchongensis]
MEIITGQQEWYNWAEEEWDLLPFVVKTSQAGGLPASWAEAWKSASPYSLLLESGKGGRYTYLGLNPVSVLKGKAEHAKIINIGDHHADPGAVSGSDSVQQGSPLETLRNWMEGFRAPRLQREGLPPFTGGCAGFLAYDAVRTLEQLPAIAADHPGFPDYLFMRFDELWIYDHLEDDLYCAVHVHLPLEQKKKEPAAVGLEKVYYETAARAEEMLALWNSIISAPPDDEQETETAAILTAAAESSGEWPGMFSAFTPEKFQQAVRDVQEYIRQGDVFQVNLSLRQEAPLRSAPEEVYEWLRRLNPSPYMGLLRSPGFALASGSPELLVKLHGQRISARPIAGTRRRGHTPAEDAAMEAELRGSEKETAEHIMLVDLERNDIGRVAAYGTVSVPELLTVERYSHVMHLVSQVEGIIAPGKDVYDVMAALFPGGTITGAPKVRTMEIIEELEPVRRGPYTGSLGWIDYGGDMELNIIIRTLAVQDGMGYIQTGAGIVIDSDPYREYRECHNKAKAVVKAVLCSELQHSHKRRHGEGGASI